MDRVTDLEVFPFPLVVFVKLTLSEYVPDKRLFALLLIETVTVVFDPALSVPLVCESDNHD